TDGDLVLRRPLVGGGGDLAAGRVFAIGDGVTCNVRNLFLHPDAPPSQPCGTPTLFTGPILQPEDAATQCAFPDTFHPSTDAADDRSVDPGSTLSLPPGRYHDIVVRGSAGQAGTLLLEGGEYDFSSLRVFRGAQLLFAAPSVVRVATDVFRIGDLSVIG